MLSTSYILKKNLKCSLSPTSTVGMQNNTEAQESQLESALIQDMPALGLHVYSKEQTREGSLKAHNKYKIKPGKQSIKRLLQHMLGMLRNFAV